MERPGLSLAGTLALLAALGLALALTAGSGGRALPAPAERGAAGARATAQGKRLARLTVARTPEVARRVEQIRGLSFEHVPDPRLAGSARLRRVAERGLSKPKVRRSLPEDEAELRLLGLLEPADEIQALLGDVTGLAAAYYQPRNEQLFVVRDAVPAGPALVEVVLAHELTHALEDQRFGLPPLAGPDERALAHTALVEGTATAVMSEYSRSRTDPLELLAEVAGIEDESESLPEFLRAQSFFSYLQGQAFVEDLYRREGDWSLVDRALRERPPTTTEQVLHPDAYIAEEPPLHVAPFGGPGPGWREVDDDAVGEFFSAQILRAGDAVVPATATDGWGGDRLQLWVRDDERVPCRSDCLADHALRIAWRWDTVTDAGEFRRALEPYVRSGLGAATTARPDTFELKGGAVAIGGAADAVNLAVAPTPALARRLAG